MRFSLGIHGYEFLRTTNYPLPAYSTLQRRMKGYAINYGIFTALEEPLSCKVSTFKEQERFCFISFDEMQISKQLDCDRNKKFYGFITL